MPLNPTASPDPDPFGRREGSDVALLSEQHLKPMAIDFATPESSNDDNQTDDDSSEATFDANELAELYIQASEYAATLAAMREANDIEWPSMESNPSMEQYSDLRSRHEDSHIAKRLTVLAVCAKGELGEEQNHVNDHSISDYEASYPELPETSWSGLTDNEEQMLSEEGIDLEGLGFDDEFEGPKLLEVEGERLPLGLEAGDVEKAERIFGKLPTEPSAATEDGFRESSDPDLFGDDDSSEDSTDKVAGDDDEDDAEAVEDSEAEDEPKLDLAANPAAVTEANALYVRSAVTDISSERTLQEMRRVEQNNGQRSSVIGRIEERLNASDVGNNAEAVEDSDDSDDEEDTEGLTRTQYNVASLLIENGEASGFEEAKSMILG